MLTPETPLSGLMLSNRIEILFEHFQERLYASKIPFAKRLVVIPSLAMKQWMVQRLAESHVAIAMGIEWCGIDEAIIKLTEHLLISSSKTIPSALEWSLAIETAIRKNIFRAPELLPEEALLWQPLFNYLKIEFAKQKLTHKSEQRLTALADLLGKIFCRYSLFGGRPMMEWSQSPAEDWQQALWQQLRQQHLHWSDWYTLLNSPIQSNANLRSLEVHLFSLSYFPPIFFHFLERLASKLPVMFYQLSPCQVFWSDLCSDRESQWLQSEVRRQGATQTQQQALEELLRDRNPLLANCGRLGREMAVQLENSLIQSEEFYSLPQSFWQQEAYADALYEALHPEPSEREEPTLLEALQADVLLMRKPSFEAPILCNSNDRSVQIVKAATPLREVQQLHDTLVQRRLEVMQMGGELMPEEILILVPNLNTYAPFIRSVFDEQESGFPIRILEWTLASQSALVQVYLQLLSLPLGRWNSAELLKIIGSKSFCLKHELTDEDLQQIRRWVEEANIWWGETAEHRHQLLIQQHCQKGMASSSEIGTWKHGFERLISGLAFSKPVQNLPSPCLLDNTKASLLSHFLRLVRSLKDDLEPLAQSHALTLREWCGYLHILYSSYLTPDLKNQWDMEGEKALTTALHLLATSASAEEKYPFTSVLQRIKMMLTSRESSHEEGNLRSIRVASLLPMRTQPARFLALLGMDEESFPRRDSMQSLDQLLHHNQSDYYPTQTDADRYLFLEAVLSARETLWVSYVGFSNDGQEIPASPVVSELIDQLNLGYRIGDLPAGEICLLTPPFHAHDPLHFLPNSPLPSYSSWRYRLASAKLASPKPYSAPLPSLTPNDYAPARRADILPIKKLKSLVRNPLEFHFREKFNLYVEERSSHPISEEHFLVSHLNQSKLCKQAITMPIDEVVRAAESEGRLPFGLFGKLARQRIYETVEPAILWLQEMQIPQSDLFNIELSESNESWNHREMPCWQLPPLEVTLDDGTQVQLVGRLERLTAAGMLLNSACDPEKRYEAYPELLILDQLANKHHLPIEPKLLFVKDLKMWSFSTPNQLPRLQQLIDLFFLAEQHPIPLLPKWIRYFFKNDAKGLQKVIEEIDSEFSQSFPFDKWLWRDGKLQEAQGVIDRWQKLAKALYDEADDASL